METESTIFEEPTLAQRLTQKRVLGKLSVLSVVVLILAGVAAAATVTLVGRIGSPQTTGRLTVTVSPMPNVPLGTAFNVYVNVTNPNAVATTVSVGIIASCPVNGVATVSGTGLTGTGDACQVGGLQTTSTALAASGTNNYVFSVTYSGNDGGYQWTFNAYP
jgi:hypothetical protein